MHEIFKHQFVNVTSFVIAAKGLQSSIYAGLSNTVSCQGNMLYLTQVEGPGGKGRGEVGKGTIPVRDATKSGLRDREIKTGGCSRPETRVQRGRA
jgi:hypothetical protein